MTQNVDLFPIFDAHMHFSQAYLDQAIVSYDECNIVGGINLWGSAYEVYDMYVYPFDYAEFLQTCRQKGLDKRYVQFYWPNWRGFGADPDGFVRTLCADMRRYADLGCRGLKVWKDIGMFIFHADGSPAVMDDPRLEPVWRTAADLQWTISIHIADPSRNWENNTKAGLSRQELFDRRDRVIAAHPEVPFILCHSANYIESVKKFGQLLDRYPNATADLSPLDAHDTVADIVKFLETYADRLYLGTDLAMPKDRPADRAWNLNELHLPLRRRWLDYDLSREVFEKITLRNGVDRFLNGHRP